MKGAMRAKLKRHRNKTSRLVDSESETADDVGGIASVSNHKTQLVASTCGFASTRSASGTPKPKKKKRTLAYVGQESSNKKKRPNSLGFAWLLGALSILEAKTIKRVEERFLVFVTRAME